MNISITYMKARMRRSKYGVSFQERAAAGCKQLKDFLSEMHL
jgi:hypothetical protein